MNISAIILAAGQSRRMGRPKLVLQWRNTTVLGKVIETIKQSGIDEITVVTGGARDKVGKIVEEHQALTIHNSDYEKTEMLSSIQLGLKTQNVRSEAVLICLGDQPQVEERNVRLICESFRTHKKNIVVPSYQMRRGHPWLVARELWSEILQLRAPDSTRDFLNMHNDEILYVEIDTPSILQDLDTPEDYLKYKP